MGDNSYKKEELNNCIDDINVKRALVSSVLFSVAIPFLILVCYFFRVFELFRGITVLIGVLVELFQIAGALIFYLLLKNKQVDRYKAAYVLYYGVTIVAMIGTAVMDMGYHGSEVLYVATCIYFIFVPIFNEKIRNFFIACQTIIMVSFILVLK